MKSTIIAALVELMSVFLRFLSVEKIRDFADFILDKVEDKIRDTSTTIDDKLVLPLVARVREACSIPDNDPEETDQEETKPEGDPEEEEDPDAAAA